MHNMQTPTKQHMHYIPRSGVLSIPQNNKPTNCFQLVGPQI